MIFPTIDYWVCPHCGTNYGPDQTQCLDAQCRAIVEREERERMEDEQADDRLNDLRCAIDNTEDYQPDE